MTERTRESLAADVDAFLRAGGTIAKIPAGVLGETIKLRKPKPCKVVSCTALAPFNGGRLCAKHRHRLKHGCVLAGHARRQRPSVECDASGRGCQCLAARMARRGNPCL